MRLREIPSLDLLRTFEATARHLSFTKAAEEMFVTQSAVSRQIKMLEEELKITLYSRGVRSLKLTEAGRRLQRTVDAIFQQLEKTIATLSELEQKRTLGISTTVSLASLWLVPRLARFRMKHPDVDIRVSATSEVQNIQRQRLDIAIRYARPEQLPQDAQILFHEKVFAVCSPKLKENLTRPLNKPSDIENHVLLHMDDACGDWAWYRWSNWFENLGLSTPDKASAIRFNQYDQMIQAAIDGQGVALGRDPLINDLLKQGALLAPFDEVPVKSGTYYLVTNSSVDENPDAASFVSWLFEEILLKS